MHPKRSTSSSSTTNTEYCSFMADFPDQRLGRSSIPLS
jgi:hypothetical protein